MRVSFSPNGVILPLMTAKRFLTTLLLMLLPLLATAQAQSVTRLVVLPFDTTEADDNYGLGLAGGLQRALNAIEGVYAPPVGDAALYFGRALDAGLDPLDEIQRAFGAAAIITGALTASGTEMIVDLAIATSGGPQETRLTVPNVPSSIVRSVVDEVVSRLGLNVDATTRARLDSIASQAPSVPALGPAGRAMSRLGVGLSDMQSAVETDAGSSWVQGEYARVLMLSGQGEAALAAADRAVELNPGDIEAVVNRGIVLQQLGRADDARQAFEAALAINSRHASALAALALASPTADEARRRLESAVDSYTRLADAHLDLAQLETSDARALQVLRRAATYLPESIPLHRTFVVRTIAAGDPQGALSYLQSVAASPLAASPFLYSLATNLPVAMIEQAITFARQGSSAFPESTIPGVTEAFLLRRNNQVAEAETLLRGLHAAHPGDVQVVYELVLAVAQLGRVDEARNLFQENLGTSDAALLDLAEMFITDGQAAAARIVVEPLAGQPDASADTITVYAVSLARTGQTAAAETAYRRALEIDPEWRFALAGLAQLQETTQLSAGGTPQLSETARAAFERGLEALGRNDLATALIEFTAAADESGDPVANFYKGYSLQLSGRVAEAIPAYEAARAGLPGSDVVLNNLGYAHFLLGRYDLALPLLRDAVAANDTNAEAHMNHGMLMFALGRYNDALSSWERAVSLQPGLETSLTALREEARNRAGQ